MFKLKRALAGGFAASMLALTAVGIADTSGASAAQPTFCNVGGDKAGSAYNASTSGWKDVITACGGVSARAIIQCSYPTAPDAWFYGKTLASVSGTSSTICSGTGFGGGQEDSIGTQFSQNGGPVYCNWVPQYSDRTDTGCH